MVGLDIATSCLRRPKLLEAIVEVKLNLPEDCPKAARAIIILKHNGRGGNLGPLLYIIFKQGSGLESEYPTNLGVI